MSRFAMGDDMWRVCFVDPDDPMLVDRTGRLTVATTDPSTLTVYLSSDLHGGFLNRVLVHELGHCALFSFHLLDDIHRMVHPSHWVEAEEWVCNFIADYGLKIFEAARAVIGDNSLLEIVPPEIERLVA